MKNRSGTYRKGRGTLPLEGGGERVGMMSGCGLKGIKCPLTLTLSPKGRGKITFNNTVVG